MLKHAILLMFLLGSMIAVRAQTISHYEYWLDGDYQGRVTTACTDTNVNVSLPLNGLSSGLHFFNFRATNKAGEISNVFRTMFYLQDMPSAATLTKSEYWIDDDYSHRVSGELKDGSISSVVDLGQQPAGLHSFNLRAFNSNNEVSNIYRTLFYLPNKDIVDIAGYEYWIDNDSLNRVSSADNHSALLLEIDVSSLNEGIHTFSFRAKNSFDEWGDIYSEEFEVMAATSIGKMEKRNGIIDVYNLRGEKVLGNANWSDFSRLPHSIYIIEGRKIVIK